MLHEPYRDRPVGTSTVEMVVDAEVGAMDLGDDDPDMLSDFGETDEVHRLIMSGAMK